MPSALITGGNKGIGKAAARQLAEKGFKVWIGARDFALGQEAAAELQGEGFEAAAVQLDVTERSSIKAAVEIIAADGESLDVLVNNAGISNEATSTPGVTIKPSELPEDKLRQLYEVNLFAPIAVIQEFLPLLRKSAAGRIVNVSSNLGSLTIASDADSPVRGINSLAYRSSKAALNMVTVQFAYELRETPIKVNSANPGAVATDLTGKGNGARFMNNPRFSTPQEGARIIVQLATLDADGPTGGFFRLQAGISALVIALLSVGSAR